MAYRETEESKGVIEKRGWKKWKIASVVGALCFVLIGGFFLYKTTDLFSKISTKNGNFLKAFIKSEDQVKGVKEGRVNILLLGMRGENIPGGSLLADTIMLLSIKPDEKKVAMFSIPRDLYVEFPGYGYHRKINAAHVIGEQKGEGKGMELMQQIVENVTGVPVHYSVTVNFQAMREVVDTLGGVEVHLDKPFTEPTQFVEGQECGGVFSLPAGDINLSGDQALCYARARFATSDFDRARRQQEILMGMKDKALSTGTLTSFGKISSLMDIVGENVRTNMESWEMQKLFSIGQRIENPEITHEVLDNGNEGFLYSTTLDTDDGKAYILKPKGDTFEYIQKICQNIFDEEELAKIKPPTYTGTYITSTEVEEEKSKEKNKDEDKS